MEYETDIMWLPPLVAGKTEDEIVEWVSDKLGDHTVQITMEDFGREALLDLGIAMMTRDRLVMLLAEEVEPQNEDEELIAQKVLHGSSAITLLPPSSQGYEDVSRHPTLRRSEDKQWVLSIEGEEFVASAVREAIAHYVQAVDARMG